MSKFYIEEAIIIETIESEPNISVETVYPEIIREKRTSILDSIFDLFSEPFFGLDELFGFGHSQEVVEEEKEPTPEPEIALIIETIEQPIIEISYAYYEVD